MVKGHAFSMRTGRWSQLRAEHVVRYTCIERFLVITMSKTSGVAEGLYGLVVGSLVRSSDRNARRRNHVGDSPVFFLAASMALRSPAIKTDNPTPKQAVRSDPISGLEGEG